MRSILRLTSLASGIDPEKWNLHCGGKTSQCVKSRLSTEENPVNITRYYAMYSQPIGTPRSQKTSQLEIMMHG